MNRPSATSERSGFSMKVSSSSRVSGSKISSTVTKEPSVQKSQEWKHTCPCDETKLQDFISVSTQCLCEEVSLEKELTLFFYNSIMKSSTIGDYFLHKESVSFETLSEISRITSINVPDETPKHHTHRRDIRKLSHEDKKNNLIGASGSQVIVKKNKRSSSKNLNKEINQVKAKVLKMSWNDIPFRYSTYFRSSNLTSYKLCKQPDLDPHFHLRRCGCRVCLKVPKISKKCDCEYCDLEKELTLYFFHEIMAKGCLEDYQMKQIASEEEPSIRSSGSNKVSEGSVEDDLKNEKVSFVDDKEHELRHESSSEGLIKVVYAKEKRPHIHKRRKSENLIGARRLFVSSNITAADKKTATEHESKTRHTGSKHKKSSKEDDEPPTHNRERRKSESLKTIPIAASLQPITEDNQTELNEKLISTTNFEQDWLVKREEKFANINFKNGNRYEGEVLDKVPHGIGTFHWADGTVYEGEFEDGSPTGRGRLQLPDLTEYIGIFYKGFFHGNGVYNIRNTNMVYSGNWKYGKKHGFGWLLYESDVWYEGDFQDDLRHGKGFFHFKDKSCYQGQYSKNNREGRGAMRWSNNDIYIGQWADGIIDGYGEYSWNTEFDNFFSFPVQHHYNGSWVKGKRTGTGIMFFGNENGAKMAGFFQDNFKHGAAIVICGNGKSIEKNPLFYNDKPLHTTSLSNEDIAKESSSCTFNEQVFQSIMKNGIPEKQWPTKCHASQVNTLLENAKQEKGSLCSPIEIQIHSPPDDVELYFYIEKALSMYVNAFDTIQFDIESIESCSSSSANVSKLQLSKWNLMTLNSVGQSKVKSYTQDNHGRPSFNQNVPVFNKSESRFQSTVRSEEKYLRNVITRYLPRLMEVYYHYATITSPKKIYFKHYMIRMFLWQLYLDIGITKIGISLVETDRLLDENPASFVESCHHPFEHIYFFQFIQSLMGTALLVHYKSREEVHSSEGLMPYIFQKFLLERVFVLAGTHRGRCLFEYKDMLPMRNVYALYLKLGQPHTARTFLNAACSKKGEDSPCYKTWSENKCRSVTNTFGQNVNIIGHNFLYIPEKGGIGASTEKSIDIPEDADPFYQDLAAFRVLGPKVVTKCLSTICPTILKNGIICNMDYSMTFLEFYEVLIICALLLVARTKKKNELYKKLLSRTNRTEEDDPQEAELRKSSGKLKKKK